MSSDSLSGDSDSSNQHPSLSSFASEESSESSESSDESAEEGEDNSENGKLHPRNPQARNPQARDQNKATNREATCVHLDVDSLDLFGKGSSPCRKRARIGSPPPIDTTDPTKSPTSIQILSRSTAATVVFMLTHAFFDQDVDTLDDNLNQLYRVLLEYKNTEKTVVAQSNPSPHRPRSPSPSNSNEPRTKKSTRPSPPPQYKRIVYSEEFVKTVNFIGNFTQKMGGMDQPSKYWFATVAAKVLILLHQEFNYAIRDINFETSWGNPNGFWHKAKLMRQDIESLESIVRHTSRRGQNRLEREYSEFCKAVEIAYVTMQTSNTKADGKELKYGLSRSR